MSFEINPVLAGKFDAPDYVPAHNFVTATNVSAISDPVPLTGSVATSAANKATAVADVSGPDPRRYTQFDRTITDAGEATDFTFSDFLDLINPLEHIPIVSSVYRSITGEHIHPVSRVAGDILYGGLMGGASAVLGGVGAIVDAGLEAETGKDAGGLAIAMLFGDEDTSDQSVQLADASLDTKAVTAPAAPAAVTPPSTTQKIELAQKASATPLLAALSLPANGESSSAAASLPALPTPEVTSPPAVAPAIETPPVAPAKAVTPGEAIEALKNAAINGSQPTGAIALAAAQPHPLNKQPYGGVMTPTAVTQAQDLATSLMRGTPGMRMGNMIYTNHMVAGSRPRTPLLSSGLKTGAAANPVVAPPPAMPAVTASPVSAVEPAVLPTYANNAQTISATGNIMSTALLNNPSAPLLQNMMLKALGQYSGTASLQPRSGASVNIIN